MKRNMDLGRKILLKIEEKDDFSTPMVPSVDGFTKLEIVYHIKLLHQANLVEAQDWSTDDGIEWVVTSLTSAGHDFLDSARSETLWNKAKGYISNKGSVLTFETLKIALSEVIKSQL